MTDTQAAVPPKAVNDGANVDGAAEGAAPVRQTRSARSTIMLSLGWTIGLTFAAWFGYLAGRHIHDNSTPENRAVIQVELLGGQPDSTGFRALAEAIDTHASFDLTAATASTLGLSVHGRAKRATILCKATWLTESKPNRLEFDLHVNGMPGLKWSGVVTSNAGEAQAGTARRAVVLMARLAQ